MLRKSFLFHALLFCLALFSQAAQANLSPEEQQLQNMQVSACQSISSLLLYRGEGFQEKHLSQMKSDLAALGSAVNGYAQADEGLKRTYQKLASTVELGATFGQGEDDVPWRYTRDLSHSLLGFLAQVERFVPAGDAQKPPTWQLPARLEFVTVLYLGRSYVGNLEIARENPQVYFGQDESMLVPALDQGINQLIASSAEGTSTKKLQSRWEYLKSALRDLDSKANSPVSISGRPWAPIIVERNARALSSQIMQASNQGL